MGDYREGGREVRVVPCLGSYLRRVGLEKEPTREEILELARDLGVRVIRGRDTTEYDPQRA